MSRATIREQKMEEEIERLMSALSYISRYCVGDEEISKFADSVIHTEMDVPAGERMDGMAYWQCRSLNLGIHPSQCRPGATKPRPRRKPILYSELIGEQS